MGKTANGVRRIDTVYFDAALQSLNRAIETYSLDSSRWISRHGSCRTPDWKGPVSFLTVHTGA